VTTNRYPPIRLDPGGAEPAEGLTMDGLLVAHQVRKVYRTGSVAAKVLRDLDPTVHPGELVGMSSTPFGRSTQRAGTASGDLGDQ
jgi:hypothetical protein